MSNPDPNFGARMAAIRREQGTKPPGRRKLAERHSADVAAVERVFASAMPVEARKYVRELDVKDPETCPNHPDEVLHCAECGHRSQRSFYNHKAAQYMFDRIMGKPTTRSEVAITVRLVEQITVAVLLAFGEINAIGDPDDRREAFAQRCRELGTHFGSDAA